jgi:hypothetical protein
MSRVGPSTGAERRIIPARVRKLPEPTASDGTLLMRVSSALVCMLAISLPRPSPATRNRLSNHSAYTRYDRVRPTDRPRAEYCSTSQAAIARLRGMAGFAAQAGLSSCPVPGIGYMGVNEVPYSVSGSPSVGSERPAVGAEAGHKDDQFQSRCFLSIFL